MYDGQGIYRHYKGGYYRALGIAQHESTGLMTVIYHSFSLDHELDRASRGVQFIARPLNDSDGADAWNSQVYFQGRFQRFERIN